MHILEHWDDCNTQINIAGGKTHPSICIETAHLWELVTYKRQVHSTVESFGKIYEKQCLFQWFCDEYCSFYPVTLFHGQIIPSQIVPLNCQIVPQYRQNYSCIIHVQDVNSFHTFASPISIWFSGICTWSSNKNPLSFGSREPENLGPISPIVIPCTRKKFKLGHRTKHYALKNPSK